MFYSIFSSLDRIGLINLDSFHVQPNTKKSNKYTFSKKITLVSFIIATGSIFFANPSAIAQQSTFQENTNNSSRILNKIESENVLNWGYSDFHRPVSYKKNALAKSAGLCADLMELLENYLKTNGLVNNEFQIKSESVPERFEGIREKKIDIECGANTIREDEEGIVFSQRFAYSKTKILIPKSKEELLKNVLNLTTNDSINIGFIKNTTSENIIPNFFPGNHSIEYFETKGDAIEALKNGKIDGQNS